MKTEKDIDIIVGCEESQAITIEFRKRGFNAFSCDLQPCSGGHPEWHLQMDLRKALKLRKWHAGIFHPTCRFLSRAGARWLYVKGELNIERYNEGLKAKEFFVECLNADIEFVGVENPTPLKIYDLPKPSQWIEPWQFGHPYSKKTLLWLKGFPLLMPTKIMSEYNLFYLQILEGQKGVKKQRLEILVKKIRVKHFRELRRLLQYNGEIFF